MAGDSPSFDDLNPSSGPILRLIDANANRLREALRVLEDCARFVLNDEHLSRRIKNLRHEVTSVLLPIVPLGSIHRDTPGDVGTGIKTEAEQERQNLLAVAIAASKRAEEAARALGEYLKIFQPPAATWMENLRYQLYDIEKAVLMRLRPQSRMACVRLYVLITESFCKQPWLKTAELAIDGGADCLQLREESLPDRELLHRARQLVDLCRNRAIPCIINNRPDIALAAKADGVHLGQGDLPVLEARRIVGIERIIGISTHNLTQAHQAVADGADYIGVGSIFKSPTKPRDFLPGLEYAEAAASQIPIPAIGIAGITAENVDQVRRTGIKAIAVTAAVTASEDVAGAARQLKKLLTD